MRTLNILAKDKNLKPFDLVKFLIIDKITMTPLHLHPALVEKRASTIVIMLNNAVWYPNQVDWP